MASYMTKIYNNICYLLDHPRLHIHIVCNDGEYRPINIDSTMSLTYDSIFDIQLDTMKGMIITALEENTAGNKTDHIGYNVFKKYYTDLDYCYSMILKCMNYVKNQSYAGSIGTIMFSTRYGENIINIKINHKSNYYSEIASNAKHDSKIYITI